MLPNKNLVMISLCISVLLVDYDDINYEEHSELK